MMKTRPIDKFRELIVYISKRSESDPSFGAVKLNKLLFYADFLAYLSLGRSITGQQYQRLDLGPAPVSLVPVRNRMVEQGEIAEQKRVLISGAVQRRTIALRDADTQVFSGSEVALVEQVLELFRQHNAKEISDLSHRFVGWRLAELGERIPYEVALVEAREPSAAEQTHGEKLVQSARNSLAQQSQN